MPSPAPVEGVSPSSEKTLSMASSPPSRPSLPTPPGSAKTNGPSLTGAPGDASQKSPNSLLGGNSPSPPLPSATQQLPPACGAKQLSKLKRFLTTLQQFGADISPEICERVRVLVLALVNSHISIEEFHSKLQESTNFPLKPFVVPFLKATLPLLQRELVHCARLARQSPQQYLARHEQQFLESSAASLSSLDQNDNEKDRKRPFSVRQGSRNDEGPSPPSAPKRVRSISPLGPLRISPPQMFPRSPATSTPGHSAHPISLHSPSSNGGDVVGALNSSNSLLGPMPIRLEDIALSRSLRDRKLGCSAVGSTRGSSESDRSHPLGSTPHPLGSTPLRRTSLLSGGDYPHDLLDRIDDDWSHIETMLTCINGMVEKTKRSLSVLQERSIRDRQELSNWMRRHMEGIDHDVKKRTNEMMAHTIRQTDDQVLEVKRRAEEAVNDVKRQAVLELQRAVALTEVKANELVALERTKMERQLKEAQKTSEEEIMAIVNAQSDSVENCWNCGRKANETCSGCNVARYCGAFCQHKNWEDHHVDCGKTAAEKNPPRKAPSTPSTSAKPTQVKTEEV